VENYGRTRQATDDNMAHAHWMLDNQDYRPEQVYVLIISFPQQDND
jgi:hypothetical protein